jgi:hypothetical protein
VAVDTRGESVVDAVVSQELFAEQLEEIRQSELPSINHWELLRVIYPIALVRMRHPSGASRNFLLDFSRYDDFPPSIKLVDESDVTVLDAAKLPQGGPHFFRYNAPTSLYPSMCYDFTAEYYDWWHADSNSVWHSKRGGVEYRALGILNQLYQLYRQTNG